MIVTCVQSFISEAGHDFRRKYSFDAMAQGKGYRLRSKSNKKDTYLFVTVEEFYENFKIELDKDNDERYIA